MGFSHTKKKAPSKTGGFFRMVYYHTF